MSPAQDQALKLIVTGIIEAVKAAEPIGAPAGPMYAAFMSRGWSLDHFEKIMGALVKAGALTKRGDCYHAR